MGGDNPNLRAADGVHELERASGVGEARLQHAFFSAAHFHCERHGIVGVSLLHFFRGDAMPRDVAEVGFIPVSKRAASAMYVFIVLQNGMARVAKHRAQGAHGVEGGRGRKEALNLNSDSGFPKARRSLESRVLHVTWTYNALSARLRSRSRSLCRRTDEASQASGR
jgi:hypothetical protein